MMSLRDLTDSLNVTFTKLHWTQEIFVGIIPHIILLCNIPVFFIVPQISSLQNSTGLVMLSLAAADSFVGFAVLLNVIYTFMVIFKHIQIDKHMCIFFAFISGIFCMISICTLAFINLDKYLILRFPLRYRLYMTRRVSCLIIAVIWISSFCFFLPLTLGHDGTDVRYLNGAYVCISVFVTDVAYTTCAFLFIQVIPTTLTFISALGVIRIVRAQKRQISRIIDSSELPHVKFVKQDFKTIKTLLYMTGGYYIMWFPFYVFVIGWDIFHGHTLHPVVNFISAWLTFCNSFVNPLIYIPTIRDYRIKLLSIRQKCKLCLQNNTSAVT